MTKKIAILEDNSGRRDAMSACLRDRFYQFESRFFACSAEMIEYLTTYWADIIAIGLDNDLELVPDEEGRLLDPGSGRDVAEYLASRPPICPVVIHTTNSDAALGIERMLGDAHWTTCRVVPLGDLEWISSQWFPAIRRAIVGPTASQKKERTPKTSE